MLRAKITVIVPVYNTELYFTKCIESIINQTYSNLQIILVDDGSTDNSGNICDQYAAQDTRIEIFHTENKGLVAARKCGIKHAKGDYIGFVDSDDYIEPEMYETLLKIITESNADFVHTGYILENEGSTQEKIDFENGIFEFQNIRDKENFLVQYVLKSEPNTIISYSIWSKLYKSDLIKKSYTLLQDEYQYGEDLYSLCLCILQSKRISLNRCALYHYVVKETSMSHLQDMEYMLKEIELCRNAIKNIRDYSEQIYQDLNNYIRGFTVRRLGLLVERLNSKIHIQRFNFKNIEILKGKKIIIWGAGAVGRDYYAQFSKYKNIEVAAWFDSNWKKYQFDYAEIVGIDKLADFNFDQIIIAVNQKETAEEIAKELLVYGISTEKILWHEPEDILDNVLN